ncbi:MAG: hypothetical protein RIB30_08770 [Thalassospira sp.]|uniref:hypothetical protein n=1 Tax=Thalassospira sp. TaxID=1912094 RepID=UPI0032EC11D2
MVAELAVTYKKYVGFKCYILFRFALLSVFVSGSFDANGYLNNHFFFSFLISYLVGAVNGIDAFFRSVNFYNKTELKLREAMKTKRENIYRYPLYIVVNLSLLIFCYSVDGFILFSAIVLWVAGDLFSILWDFWDRKDFGI